MVQPPSMSHASENILEANPFLGKFLDFVKRWIVKVWIWIVVGMLFVIGTGDVVLYRILYMAIFLIFTVTFIVSKSVNLQRSLKNFVKLPVFFFYGSFNFSV